MRRRRFLQDVSMLAGSMMILPSVLAKEKEYSLMSVIGPIKPNELGITLIHEHVMADFIGAAETVTHRYQPDKIVEKALPYLLELKKAGCRTLIDCTPVYLGRDHRVLRQCAQASGLNIFTTTGYYCAVNQEFLPPHAYTEAAERLAARWIEEHRE